MRLCPFCAEEIRLAATKCRHCSETLDPVMRKAEEAARIRSIRTTQVGVQPMIVGEPGRPKGSWIALIFWLLVFFPIGIIYFFIRRWW